MNVRDVLIDPTHSGKLILALQRAASKQFTNTDWEEFGYETGEYDYIRGHGRLLRSLYFGDEDYGSCVFQVLRYFADNKPTVIEAFLNNKKIRVGLENDAPELMTDLGLLGSHVPAVVVRNISSSQVVERALADSEHLLVKSGPVSCIDRLHTALHGYLKDLCSQSGLTIDANASITQLFKLLRADHPMLQNLGNQDKDIVRILNSLSNVIDSVNTIRNHGSVAHPNENLLGDAEALLVVNVTRTLFHYINSKVQHAA